MERNHQYLANRIYEIEHADWKQQLEWSEAGVHSWKIARDIRVEKSDDHMMWYLWWTDNKYHYGDVVLWKCVPRISDLDVRQITAILKAQPWVCI